MGRDKRGNGWIFLGLLLIAAALLLTGYNMLTQRRAAEASAEVLRELKLQQAAEAEAKAAAEEAAALAAESTAGAQGTVGAASEAEAPLYVQNPHMEMPVSQVSGYDYIGVLSIPALGLELPVMSEWDYTRLNIAPCRYSGSAYQDNLIICAHNFEEHFGWIKSLQVDDAVFFTDAEGHTFLYAVSELETLKPTDTDYLDAGDWDLTLFTCTVGGATRMTVRCVRVE